MNVQLSTKSAARLSIEPQLSKMQDTVYKFLTRQTKPMSCEQIAQSLNKPQHTITPRLLELKEIGLVVIKGEGKSSSGRRVNLYMSTRDWRQPTLWD